MNLIISLFSGLFGSIITLFIQHIIAEKELAVTWQQDERIVKDKDPRQYREIIYINNPNARVVSLWAFVLFMSDGAKLKYQPGDKDPYTNKYPAFILVCANGGAPLQETVFINPHTIYPLEIRYDKTIIGTIKSFHFVSNASGNFLDRACESCGQLDFFSSSRSRCYVTENVISQEITCMHGGQMPPEIP